MNKLAIAAAAAITLSTATSGFAQTTTWKNNTPPSALWDNTPATPLTPGFNWVGNTLPSATISAVLPSIGAGLGSNPVIGNTDVTAKGLVINNAGGHNYSITSSGTGRLHLGSGGLTVTGSGSTTTIDPGITLDDNAAFNIDSGATTILNGELDVNGFQMTKSGAGRLVLNATSTALPPSDFNPLLITGGTLEIRKTDALGGPSDGDSSHSVYAVVGPTATLELHNTTTTANEEDDIVLGSPFDQNTPNLDGGFFQFQNDSTLKATFDAFTGGIKFAAIGGNRSPRIDNNANVTFQISGSVNGVLEIDSRVGNSTINFSDGHFQPSGATINVVGDPTGLTNTGRFNISGGSRVPNAYTGTWNIDTDPTPDDAFDGDFSGITNLFVTAGLGVPQNPDGTADRVGVATLKLTSGEFWDRASANDASASTPAHPELTYFAGTGAFQNNIEIAGGWFAADAVSGDLNETHRYEGTLKITATGNSIYKAVISTESSFFAQDNQVMLFTGKVSGAGQVLLQGWQAGGVDAPSLANIIFSNTATGAGASDFTGAIFVSEDLTFTASTTLGGSSPLGGTATEDSAIILIGARTTADRAATLVVEEPSTATNTFLTTYLNNAIITANFFVTDSGLDDENGDPILVPVTNGLNRVVVGPGDGPGTNNTTLFDQWVANDPDTTLTVASLGAGYSFGVVQAFVEGNTTIQPDPLQPSDFDVIVVRNASTAGGTLIKAGSNTMNVYRQVLSDGLNVQGGTVNIVPGSGVSKVKVLTIAAPGVNNPSPKFDIGDNAIVIDYVDTLNAAARKASVDGFKAQIITGRGVADGFGIYDYSGLGITSEIAGAANDFENFNKYAIGFIDNKKLNELGGLGVGGGLYTQYGDPSSTTFPGVTLDESAIILSLTYNGDANLDGVIDVDDYALINYGFAHRLDPGAYISWLTGDFNLDGVIDALDYAIIDFGFLNGGNIPFSSGGPSSVPEPTSLSLLALGGAALMGRRRRTA